MNITIKYYKRNTGMTLIELVIVIAIIGILSAIAIPLFQSQSLKKNRAMAVSSLLQARAQMEKCFLNSQNSIYDDCTFDATKSIDKTKLYQISILLTPAVNATSYVLTANNLNAKNDVECSSYTIDNVGIKTSSGTGSLQRCWSN